MAYDLLISVVICTHNRAALLERLLHTLCGQTLTGSDYEILIVDNNSSDETGCVAKDFMNRNGRVRYIFEPAQGLSHARNRGWQEARGEYVAYTDDDCRIPAEWLAVAKDVIVNRRPVVFGGPYYACYDTPKPMWFKDVYASHVQGERGRLLREDEYLDGMNIFFRRSILAALGGFDPNLGMTGNTIAYGEETDLLLRIRSSLPQEQIYYEPELFVHHLVRKEKMQATWIMRQRFASGRYSAKVFGTDAVPEAGLPGMARQLLSVVGGLLREVVSGIVLRDRREYPYLQNYLYERIMVFPERLGVLYSQYQNYASSNGRVSGTGRSK